MEINVSDTNLFSGLSISSIGVGSTCLELAKEKKPSGKSHSHVKDKFKNSNYKKDPVLVKVEPIKFAHPKEDLSCTSNVQVGKPLAEACKVSIDPKTSINIASTVLSAVNVPEAEPLKMAVNYLSTDTKKEDLATSFVKGDYESATTNSLNFAKSGWGTAVSAAKLTDNVVNISVDFGLLSTNMATKVGTVTSSVSSIASKITIPLAVVGTGLSGWDIKKSQGLINEKSKQIRELEKLNNKLSVKIIDGNKPKLLKTQIARSELKVLKTDRNIKAVAFGLSAISTGALIASVAKPSSAKVMVPVSFASGLASSVTAVFADKNLRTHLSYNIRAINQVAAEKIKDIISTSFPQ